MRRAVDEVLSRSEYADLEPGLIDRAIETVLDLVSGALGALDGTVAGTILGVVVLVAAVAGVAWLAARAIRRVRTEPTAAVVTFTATGRGAEAWLADAEEHEAAGRLREAVRCRYRAVVAALASEGIVEEVPGRTAGEYLALVEAAPGVPSAAFASLTRAFERAWYGADPVTPDELAAFRGDEARLRAELRGVPATAGRAS